MAEEQNKITFISVYPGQAPACPTTEKEFMYKMALNFRDDYTDADIASYVKEKVSDDRKIVILCDLKAGELDYPMNRFVSDLPNNECLPIVGNFVIVASDKNGYCSLTEEEIDKYLLEFVHPHEFMVMFDKLLIFERRNLTELNMIHSFDIDTLVEEQPDE